MQKYPFLSRKERVLHHIKRIKNMNTFRKVFLLFSLLITFANLSIAKDTKLNFKLLQLSQQESASHTPIAVLICGDINYLKEELPRLGGTFKFSSGNIISAMVPADRIVSLSLTQVPHRFASIVGAVSICSCPSCMFIANLTFMEF